VSDLEADIQSGQAHETIKQMWASTNSRYWNKRDMNILLRNLSVTRATITHKEDRNVDYYRKLTEEQVRSTFSSVRFRESALDLIPDHLVQAALNLHKLTATPPISQSSEKKAK
jgi:hypothetical protein